MKAKGVLAGIVCSAMLLAGGCGASESGEMKEISLCEVTHSVFYAPLYATIELGYFEDAGLDVELVNGGGADKVMTAVLSKQSDIGFAGPEACIYTYIEGHEDYPKVFGQLTKRDGSFSIVKVQYSMFAGGCRKQSKLHIYDGCVTWNFSNLLINRAT